MNRKEYEENEGHHIREDAKEYFAEVVNVECSECGLVSNWIDGWEEIESEEYGYFYYICPTCAEESNQSE